MKLALRASSPSPSLRDFRNVQSDAAVKPQIYFFSDVYWNCPNLKERIYNSDFIKCCKKAAPYKIEKAVASTQLFPRQG